MNSTVRTDLAQVEDAEPLLRCEGVWLGYGRVVVLRDVTFSVSAGWWIWLVGRNGAGKSTLLRAIAGLLRPQRGRIVREHSRTPPGVVLQQAGLDPWFPLTVREIVEMGLLARHRGWWGPPAAVRPEVDRVLSLMGLEGVQDKILAELSGGTRQKVLLARALATDSELLLLDEATSEIDAATEQAVWAELARRVEAQRCAVLYAHQGTLPSPRVRPPGREWVAEVADGTVRVSARKD